MVFTFNWSDGRLELQYVPNPFALRQTPPTHQKKKVPGKMSEMSHKMSVSKHLERMERSRQENERKILTTFRMASSSTSLRRTTWVVFTFSLNHSILVIVCRSFVVEPVLFWEEDGHRPRSGCFNDNRRWIVNFVCCLYFNHSELMRLWIVERKWKRRKSDRHFQCWRKPKIRMIIMIISTIYH